jgi:hypothetical protein
MLPRVAAGAPLTSSASGIKRIEKSYLRDLVLVVDVAKGFQPSDTVVQQRMRVVRHL